MEEDIEIIKCAEEYACELNPKSKREYKNFVNAYIAGAEEMRKRCDRQISKLTEQLDTAHAFCEIVHNHYIDKACKELCHSCTNYENCEGYCDRYKHFFESMKGE